MNTNEKNAICLAINEQYVHYAQTLITSLTQNNKWFNYDIVIVGDDEYHISYESLNKLRKIYPNIIQKTFQKTKKMNQFLEKFLPHITRPNWKYVYLKLYAFELDEYEKVLFLDADIIINGDISEIFQSTDDINMGIDTLCPSTIDDIYYQNKWLPYKGEYCNVGVIYYGNKNFRKRLKNEFIDFSLTYDFSPVQCKKTNVSKSKLYGDTIEQDMLNYYLLNHKNIKCRILPVKYNTCNTIIHPKLLNDAHIIHYWSKPCDIYKDINLGIFKYFANISLLYSLIIFNNYDIYKINKFKNKQAICIIVLKNSDIFSIICKLIFQQIDTQLCDIYIFTLCDIDDNICKKINIPNVFYCNVNYYNKIDNENQLINIKTYVKDNLQYIYNNINFIPINEFLDFENNDMYITFKEYAQFLINEKKITKTLYNKLSVYDKKCYINKKIVENFKKLYDNNKILFNIDIKPINKYAVIAQMKNTPVYLLNNWLNYYIKIGFDIYICEDINSNIDYELYVKTYFNDYNNIHVCKLNQSVLNILLYECDNELYQKYLCTGNLQIVLYNQIYKEIKTYYNWITILDDDEFLNIDLTLLEKNDKIECLSFPRRIKFTKSLYSEKALNNYETYDIFDFNCKIDLTDKGFIKSIVNTKYNDLIKSYQHELTLNNLFYDGKNYIPFKHIKNNLNILRLDPFLSTSNCWIDHYYIRSLEEDVKKIFDRGDVYNPYNNILKRNISNRQLCDHYFYTNPNITISGVIKDLKEIGRDDVIQKIYDDPFVNAYKIKLDNEFLKVMPIEKLEEKYSKEIVDKYLDFINNC